ncbi:MAG: thioredoxin [Ruminococcus sp.]|nr:thioredoxin [Ruminococcus sp.]
MEKIYEEDFDKLVLQAEHPVVIDFYADWCGPCQALAPVLEELERENDDFAFYRVNVEECHELAVKYKVFTLPTVVFFRNGRAVAQSIGLKPPDELQKILNGI